MTAFETFIRAATESKRCANYASYSRSVVRYDVMAVKMEPLRESPIREEPLPLPGQHLDQTLSALAWNEGLEYVLAVALTLVLALGALAQYLLPTYPIYWVFFGITIAAAVWAAIGFRRIHQYAQRLKLGRQGERVVGQLLPTLDLPGTRVFHDIPTDRGNLDHVIVCDRGIYVVETKTWRKATGARIEVRSGHLYMRGRRVKGDPVGQVSSGARWLNQLLQAETGHSFECRPVVVLPGWFVKPMDAATKRVAWVLEPKALLAWIPKEPVRLQAEEIRRIERAIAGYIRRGLGEQQETWRR